AMKWISFSVETSDIGLEIVAAALDAAGIPSVELVESRAAAMAALNSSALYWDFADPERIGADVPRVLAYLPDLPESRPVLEAARAAVEGLPALVPELDLGTLEITLGEGDDADWENAWKRFYAPMEIGRRLLVLPEWEPVPETERVVLRLDPGVAFGTGAHHTTRMCLAYLDECVREGMSVLDLGCGSGILAIAARLLGAAEATAVDIDPLAVKIACENAQKNGLTRGFRALTGELPDDAALRAALGGPCDLIVANIVAGVVIRLAPLARTLAKPGAPFIASGVIEEREAEVCAALEAAGFFVEERRRSGGWVALLARG
ncbi:MAG: 50S ribosomal protein L11 methyltransferase, partial [Clostridia bacterium]|nr:50S ribosomal protein L11 methyltransferase [Clostridia bacterium]